VLRPLARAPHLVPLEVLVAMACAKCNDLCVRFAIQQPYELRRAIEIAKQNVEDGTISEIPDANPLSQVSFSALAAGKPWDDIVAFRFRCNSCAELFSLHAETYHGSGGYWEPENNKSVRKNL
jgi:hypothetical protein